MSDNFDDLVSSARDAERQRQISRADHERQASDRERAEKEKHAVLAKKFISAMRSRGIPPLPVYKHGVEHYRKWSWSSLRFVSRQRELPNKIGEGWNIRDHKSASDSDSFDVPGLVLMTDGKVYEYDGASVTAHFLLPEPHLFISGSWSGDEPDQLLGRSGWDKGLAEAVVAHEVAHEQGRLKSPNQLHIRSHYKKSHVH